MIALLCLSLAWAEPAVLRAPQRGVGVAGGLRSVSIGGWTQERLGLFAEVTTSGSALTLGAGTRWELGRDRRGWGGYVVLTGGALIPTATPGLGLVVTPSITGGFLGDRVGVTFALVSPLGVAWSDGVQATLPALVELGVGGRAGPVWIGGRVQLGAAWSPGLDTSIRFDPGLTLTWVGPRDPAP